MREEESEAKSRRWKDRGEMDGRKTDTSKDTWGANRKRRKQEGEEKKIIW